MATLYHSKRKSQTVLNNGGSLSAGGVSVTVLSAAALPTPPYLAYIEPGVVGQEELVAVTSVASNTLTIIRGLDGTTGVSHPDGSAIKNITASLAWEDLLSIFQLHKHTGADNSAVIVDATVPSTQTFGDTPAAGTGTKVPRIDHVHGMPLYPSFNALANGDFAFAQTGLTSNPLVNGVRNLDEWAWLQSGDGSLWHTRIDGAATSIYGGISLASYSYINVVTARTTSAAGDNHLLSNYIEGWDARHLVNGCSFSGWFLTTLAGTYCFTLRNRDGTYSYVHPVTFPASSWTYVTFTIPAWPSAAIVGDFRAQIGAIFEICLSSGASFQTASPDTWVTGNLFRTSAQTNFAATLSAAFYMHALNLVPGPYPQPFVPMPYEQELRRVQRHRQIVSIYPDTLGITQAINGTQFYGTKQLEVEMLGTPTMTLSAAGHWTAFSANATSLAVTGFSFNPSKRMINYSGTVASGLVAGNAALVYASNASALLYAEAYPV
jgi:hypothetical protein